MDEADDLLINQVGEELEPALQEMERRALRAIDPNAADAAAGPLTADVAQVCPARFAIVCELWCMQSRNKRTRADGEEALPGASAQAQRSSRCASSLWSGERLKGCLVRVQVDNQSVYYLAIKGKPSVTVLHELLVRMF